MGSVDRSVSSVSYCVNGREEERTEGDSGRIVMPEWWSMLAAGANSIPKVREAQAYNRMSRERLSDA